MPRHLSTGPAAGAVAVRPGMGTEAVALGATQEQIRARLGPPGKVVDHLPLSYLFAYPELGLEIDFVVPSGQAEVIFFYGHNWDGHGHAAVQTAEGIGFGSSREEVRRVLGEPAGSDEAYTLDRRLHTAWMYYTAGIQFHFDQAGRMVIMAVCAPARGAVRLGDAAAMAQGRHDPAVHRSRQGR